MRDFFILQIGDHSTREMSPKDFGELLQTEAMNGTTLYFISGSSSERSLPEVEREKERKK